MYNVPALESIQRVLEVWGEVLRNPLRHTPSKSRGGEQQKVRDEIGYLDFKGLFRDSRKEAFVVFGDDEFRVLELGSVFETGHVDGPRRRT